MEFQRVTLLTLAAHLLFAIALEKSQAQGTKRYKLRMDRLLTDNSTAASLSYVQQAIVGKNGEVYLLDYGSKSVVRVSEEGKYLGTSGRRGQGPGEFKSVGSIGLTARGFWITDPSQRRVSIFTQNGEHERTIALSLDPEAADSRRSSNIVGLLPNEAIVSQVHMRRPLDVSSNDAFSDTPILIRHDQQGKLFDTVAILAPFEGRVVQAKGRSTGKIVLSPIQARTIVEFSADGHAHAVIRQVRNPNGSFTLHVAYFVDGALRYRRQVPHVAIKMTARLRDEYLRRTGAVAGSDEWRAAKQLLTEVTELPPAANAFVARDGRLWIQRLAPDRSKSWVILDQMGRVAGSAEAPPRVQLFEADTKYSWAIVYDDNDVPSVARFILGPSS